MLDAMILHELVVDYDSGKFHLNLIC